ncbi:hypothetical protein BC830DRAFT_1087719 [Chytriomyces sp. MP71]|nr:hypothetical protein BC830DRAFT_1087719 [Chytriomyces sp. MP71]
MPVRPQERLHYLSECVYWLRGRGHRLVAKRRVELVATSTTTKVFLNAMRSLTKLLLGTSGGRDDVARARELASAASAWLSVSSTHGHTSTPRIGAHDAFFRVACLALVHANELGCSLESLLDDISDAVADASGDVKRCAGVLLLSPLVDCVLGSANHVDARVKALDIILALVKKRENIKLLLAHQRFGEFVQHWTVCGDSAMQHRLLQIVVKFVKESPKEMAERFNCPPGLLQLTNSEMCREYLYRHNGIHEPGVVWPKSYKFVELDYTVCDPPSPVAKLEATENRVFWLDFNEQSVGFFFEDNGDQEVVLDYTKIKSFCVDFRRLKLTLGVSFSVSDSLMEPKGSEPYVLELKWDAGIFRSAPKDVEKILSQNGVMNDEPPKKICPTFSIYSSSQSATAPGHVDGDIETRSQTVNDNLECSRLPPCASSLSQFGERDGLPARLAPLRPTKKDYTTSEAENTFRGDVFSLSLSTSEADADLQQSEVPTDCEMQKLMNQELEILQNTLPMEEDENNLPLELQRDRSEDDETQVPTQPSLVSAKGMARGQQIPHKTPAATPSLMQDTVVSTLAGNVRGKPSSVTDTTDSFPPSLAPRPASLVKLQSRRHKSLEKIEVDDAPESQTLLSFRKNAGVARSSQSYRVVEEIDEDARGNGKASVCATVPTPHSLRANAQVRVQHISAMGNASLDFEEVVEAEHQTRTPSRNVTKLAARVHSSSNGSGPVGGRGKAVEACGAGFKGLGLPLSLKVEEGGLDQKNETDTFSFQPEIAVFAKGHVGHGRAVVEPLDTSKQVKGANLPTKKRARSRKQIVVESEDSSVGEEKDSHMEAASAVTLTHQDVVDQPGKRVTRSSAAMGAIVVVPPRPVPRSRRSVVEPKVSKKRDQARQPAAENKELAKNDRPDATSRDVTKFGQSNLVLPPLLPFLDTDMVSEAGTVSRHGKTTGDDYFPQPSAHKQYHRAHLPSKSSQPTPIKNGRDTSGKKGMSTVKAVAETFVTHARLDKEEAPFKGKAKQKAKSSSVSVALPSNPVPETLNESYIKILPAQKNNVPHVVTLATSSGFAAAPTVPTLVSKQAQDDMTLSNEPTKTLLNQPVSSRKHDISAIPGISFATSTAIYGDNSRTDDGYPDLFATDDFDAVEPPSTTSYKSNTFQPSSKSTRTQGIHSKSIESIQPVVGRNKPKVLQTVPKTISVSIPHSAQKPHITTPKLLSNDVDFNRKTNSLKATESESVPKAKSRVLHSHLIANHGPKSVPASMRNRHAKPNVPWLMHADGTQSPRPSKLLTSEPVGAFAKIDANVDTSYDVRQPTSANSASKRSVGGFSERPTPLQQNFRSRQVGSPLPVNAMEGTHLRKPNQHMPISETQRPKNTDRRRITNSLPGQLISDAMSVNDQYGDHVSEGNDSESIASPLQSSVKRQENDRKATLKGRKLAGGLRASDSHQHRRRPVQSNLTVVDEVSFSSDKGIKRSRSSSISLGAEDDISDHDMTFVQEARDEVEGTTKKGRVMYAAELRKIHSSPENRTYVMKRKMEVTSEIAPRKKSTCGSHARDQNEFGDIMASRVTIESYKMQFQEQQSFSNCADYMDDFISVVSNKLASNYNRISNKMQKRALVFDVSGIDSKSSLAVNTRFSLLSAHDKECKFTFRPRDIAAFAQKSFALFTALTEDRLIDY